MSIGSWPCSLGSRTASEAPGSERRCWERLFSPCLAAKWRSVSFCVQSMCVCVGGGGGGDM